MGKCESIIINGPAGINIMNMDLNGIKVLDI